MEIRMPILDHHYYRMVMRSRDCERQGRCFRLSVRELTPQEGKMYEGRTAEGNIPTCRIRFYDFEYWRVVEGWLKENTEESLVLEVGRGKEYEFSPLY